MAEGALFSIAEKLIEKLGSLAVQEVALCWGFKDQLRKLNGTLTRIKAVILDAEEKAQKQKHNHQIKDWLKKLGGAVYDAEDLLDDFTAEIQKKQLMPGYKIFGKVRIFFSESNQFVYGLRMGHEVKALRERLDDIFIDSERFNFDSRDEETGFLITDWRQTTSSEPEVTVGREGDKLAVKNFLLNSNYKENVSVVSVVGIGGLGKTTLAQHVFNDEQVKAHFGERRLWVSVSGVLNVRKILKGVVDKDFDQLESLKNEFEKEFGKEKYLLVLDDVRDGKEWDSLKQLLPRDAVGSKIMVTTRSEVIAKFTSTIEPHVLEGLSEDESWDLFRRKAFRQDEQSGHVDKEIREEIVKRCCGVPLVIKTIARLMFLKDRALWLSFIKNELPDVVRDENFLQTFMYNALPSYLKSCFSYSSLFPKGQKIDVKSLCQVLIAEGFFRSPKLVACAEKEALECFENLLWSSIFQNVEKGNLGIIESCRMHDFMHVLATHVAGLDRTKVEPFGDSTRHVSFDKELDLTQSKIPIPLSSAKLLRTLILTGCKWDERKWKSICRNFGHLRVLVLNYLGIKKVSPLIEKLKLLKYLDLSDNQMEALPNSITNLVNLQVLKLDGCRELKILPREMNKLKNLWHLGLDICGLEYMPRGIGELNSLQTLSLFVFAKNSSHKSKMVGGLDELKKLNELRGSLKISVKEYERNSWIMSEFKGAILKDKHHLQSLTIEWAVPELYSNSSNDLYDEMLHSLRPNENLRELKVELYGGMRFPSWLSHLSNIVSIYLLDCSRLLHIPPLDGIRSLEKLRIEKMESLEYIDSEGVGGKGVSTFFPSLKELVIRYCMELKGWWKKSDDEMNDDSDEIMLCFPRLSYLYIEGCPNLTSMPLFPTLDRLDLDSTSSMPLQQTMKMTAPVSSSSSSSSSFIRPLSKLKELSLSEIEDMESFPEIWLQNLSSLQQLTIDGCSRLKSLPLPDQGMHSLQKLMISDCRELKCLSQSESQGVKGWWKKSSDEMNDDNDEIMLCFPILSSLRIDNCPNLTSMPLFPTLDRLELHSTSSMLLQQTMKMTAPVSSSSSSSSFIRPLSKLKELSLSKIEDMESFPEIGLQNLSSLQRLVIFGCSRLKSLPLPDQGMDSLQKLEIRFCGELKCLSQSKSQGVIPDLPSLQHLRIENVGEELSGRIRGWGKECVDWPIIKHIPNIAIDQYYIQKDGRYVKEEEEIFDD